MEGSTRRAVCRDADPAGQLQRDRPPWIASTAAALFGWLHGTCRFQVAGEKHLKAAFASGSPVLITTWHFAFPAVIHFFRNRSGVVMVSRSRDGEWIAQVLRCLGYRTARGSPGKGGAAALRRMLDHIRAGRHAGLIADGSQGPARVAQSGILLLARYSQAPLLPVSMAASPCWRFRSWDRTVLAKPFSRVALTVGPPLRVPRGADSREMEFMRIQLQNRLNALSEEAEAALKRM